MTPDLRTLAAAVTALPGWEWRPGMRAIFPSGQGVHIQALDAPSGICGAPPAVCLPDLTDPATGGALLALMERAEPNIEMARSAGMPQKDAPWCALATPGAAEWVTGEGATFGEATARLALKRGGWA